MPAISKTTAAMLLRLAIAALVALTCPLAAAAEVPESATVLDPNLLWDVTDPDCFAISPDGKQIAYISKGALWASSVDHGPPEKLADLPETMTALLTEPKFQPAINKVSNIPLILAGGNRQELWRSAILNKGSKTPAIRPPNVFQELWHRRVLVMSLRWTPSSDGVTYALRKGVTDMPNIYLHRVMHASLEGVVSEIATIERQSDDRPSLITHFHLTPDRKLIIAANGALIWNVAAQRPQASLFDLLAPSSTSGRYLGIEIDSLQLVLVDENLQIVKRFNVNFKPERQVDLCWSPDERYALCRRKGYSSERWIALRVDLLTGAERQFKGNQWTDRFAFTGRGGELIQYGIEGLQTDYVDHMRAAYLTLIPDGEGAPRDLVRFDWTPELSRLIAPDDRALYPPMAVSSDGTMFAVALPRESKNHPGFVFHLVDRDGNRRPIAADDESQYLVPGYVIALANNNRTAIVRNATQLFSIPIDDAPPATEAAQ